MMICSDNKLQWMGYALLVFTLWNLIPAQRILLLQPNFPKLMRLSHNSITNEKLHHAGLFMFFKNMWMLKSKQWSFG